MDAVGFNSVVFDLGNVLIEWNPRLLLSDEFIAETDFFTWNAELDQGASFDAVVARVRADFPDFAHECDAFRDRWPDLLGPVDDAVVAIVDELQSDGVRTYLLSNSSAETVPRSPVATDLLTRFDGVLLSGDVGILKPDPAIFRLAEERFGLDPPRTLFIDDSQANVDAATACGWRGHHFTEAGLIPVGGRSS
ncbi:MAG: 2-haloacid dehalogenase [Actinomycetota bacterium]